VQKSSRGRHTLRPPPRKGKLRTESDKAEDCIGSAQIELRQEPRDWCLSASDTIP
jgi:hypothetical protein